MLFDTKIKSLSEILEECGELRRRGNWCLINIDPSMPWPIAAQSFEFENHEIWVIPVTEDAYPALATCDPREGRDECWAMLHRALSILCWMEDGGASVYGMGGGNPFPHYGWSGPRLYGVKGEFDLSEMPVVTSPDAKLALALMREGRALRHPAFSFLTFYRVLERAFPDGKVRAKWMRDAVERLSDHQAQRALDKVRANIEGDIGHHLFASGRCAIAHARGDPTINPDEPQHLKRLQQELPIMEALASTAIEEQLSVKTSHTIWEEHLYELRGWKSALDMNLIENCFSGVSSSTDAILQIPSISVRLRRKDPFPPFEKMIPIGWNIEDQKLVLVFGSKNQFVRLKLILDFVKERMILPLQGGIEFSDDGSVEAAQSGKAIEQFTQAYNANGELLVCRTDDGMMLSRCDPFMPFNVRFDPIAAEAVLKAWDAEIERRNGPAATQA